MGVTLRRLALALLIALGACGLTAGPAAAVGTLTPVDAHLVAGLHHLAGPSFAGEGVAWATPRWPRFGYKVSVAAGGEVRSRNVFALGGNPDAPEQINEALAASPDEVAFLVNVTRCARPDCRYAIYVPVQSALFAGPLGRPLDFRQCGGADESEQSADLEGTTLAYFNGCTGAATVRDIAADPDVPWREYPSAGRVRIAGHYLAVNLYPGDGDFDEASKAIAVYDLRSGDQLYKLDQVPRVRAFDIQDDGTVAFERMIDAADGPRTYELDWASIEEPAPHPVAPVGLPGEVRITGGHIAVRDGDLFRVLDLGGTELAATPAHDAIGSFDFDGHRLAFGLQPCEVTAIATWDLKGTAPGFPAGRCPRARLIGRVGVADLGRRRARVHVRCPAMPALGCSGDWFAQFPDSGHYVHFVALAPGERATLRLPLLRPNVCRLARHDGGKVTIYLGADSTRRRAVKLHGELIVLKTVGRARGCRG